jgi:ribulose-phosphate 3-epimerase
MVILAPSLLASDFSNLESEIKKVYINGDGCAYLHLDVMDGIFVKNISFGAPVISSIRKVCGITFDVHLMITSPIRYIPDFVKAGADIITFHCEACEDENEIKRTIDLIKESGKKCSLSIKPATPVGAVLPFLDELDMVLVMSVEPGFGGQKFIEGALGKIGELSEIKTEKNYRYDIEVDGGVTLENLKKIKEAGANMIVAGSSIFGAENAGEMIARFMDG